jgi:hypothetical protein
MRDNRFLPLLLFIFVLNTTLNAQWARVYVGKKNERAFSIQETYDGGLVVAGYTDSYGAGVSDFWILKLKPRGKIEWQRTYGGRFNDWGFAIQQTIDMGYIVVGATYSFGAGESDIWVLKLDSEGEIEWQKTYGKQGYERAFGVQQTLDGGYIVLGDTNSFGSKSYDLWLLKLDAQGEIEWQCRYGGNKDEYASNSVLQTYDGGYIIGGVTESFRYKSWSAWDPWILKLNSWGQIEWQHVYGGGGVSSIQQTLDGGYIVGCASYDFLFLKLNSAGGVEWSKEFGGSEDEWLRSVKQTVDGGYILTGETKSFGSGAIDILTLKLDPKGGIIWQRVHGGSEDDIAHCIYQTTDGRYILTGITDSFGLGADDLLVLKLNMQGLTDQKCKLEGNVDVSVRNPVIGNTKTPSKAKKTKIIPDVTNIKPNDTSSIAFNFCERKRMLHIEVGSGGSTSPPPGINLYRLNKEVTIKAIPVSDYYFNGWSGDVTGSLNPITITMDSHKLIKANFWRSGSGGGGGYGGDWGDGGGGGGGGWGMGGCFIATAAYGSFLHPHVKILREFRDKYLMSHKLGRSIVNIYYKFSPSIARFIAKHKALKFPVRISLLPFVSLSYSLLLFGPVITAAMLLFLVLFPILFINVFRRRRKISEE